MRAPQPLLFVGWQLFCDFLDQVPKRFRRQAGEGLNDCGMLAQTAFCEHGIPPHSGGWITDGWKIPCSPIIVNRLYTLLLGFNPHPTRRLGATPLWIHRT